MKKVLCLIVILISLCLTAVSQSTNPTELKQTAREFMKTGDWDNAILLLNRSLTPNNFDVDLQKDLLLCYFYKRDFEKAIALIKISLLQPTADVPLFQIAGNVYQALGDIKEEERVYKLGIKKFPKSGPLYNKYGELLKEKKDPIAIDFWEKGIESDPGYSGNYFNAAQYYYNTPYWIWTFLYGEIFVNMESLNERAIVMKELLLRGYKEKFFLQLESLQKQDEKGNEFIAAFSTSMGKLLDLTSKGVTVEALSLIRTRFILDWFGKKAEKFPFRLFDYQQQLLREGLFDAYNQWLFGVAENIPTYQFWTKTNSEVQNRFLQFMRNRVFKIPQNQYYRFK